MSFTDVFDPDSDMNRHGYFADPYVTAALGALQSLGSAAAPSRLPVTNGMVLGSLAGGLLQGAGQGFANQRALSQRSDSGGRSGLRDPSSLLAQYQQLAAAAAAGVPGAAQRMAQLRQLIQNTPDAAAADAGSGVDQLTALLRTQRQ